MTIILVCGLFPLALIGYIYNSIEPTLIFKHFLFHELAILVAVSWSASIAYIAYQCYLARRETFLRYLTLAFLGQAIIYSMHGLLTRTADDIPILFILYGPASRLIMAAFLLAALLKYSTSERDTASRKSWTAWISIFVIILPATALLAISPIGTHFYLRAGMETLSVGLYLIALGVFFYRRINTPLMWLYSVALVLFAQSSLAFILVKAPWNHMFWLAHLMFAAGFLVLSYGLIKARKRSSTFTEIFNEEQLYSKLEEEVSKQQSEINTRKQVEAELRKSQQRLTEAQRIGKIGDWSLDIPSGDIFWSDEIYRIFGRTPADFSPSYERFIETVHPDDLAKVLESQERSYSKNNKHSVDHRTVLPDGEIRWVHEEAEAVFDENDSPVYLAGTVEDITDRKLSEIALQESERRVKSIVTNVPSVIYRCANDSDWTIEFINDQIEILSGYPASDFLNKTRSFASIIHPDDREAVEQDVGVAVDNRQPYTLEYRIVNAKGETRWVHEKGQGVFDENNEFLWLDGSFEDITQSKQVNLLLSRSKEEAESANKAKSEFLSRMSHELRTPMNAILGFAQLLKMHDDLSPDTMEHIEEIYVAGKHLLVLINEILDLESIESGRIELNMENIHVAKAISGCMAIISPLASDRNITIKENPKTCKESVVAADATRLKQILLNLLTNAVKYNRENGEIDIHCSKQNKDLIRISISDTGLGIGKGQHEKLFEPFFRAGVEATGIEGTGIGLTVTKLLVENMGGKIGFYNKPERGCTFWVDLPMGSF